MTLIRIQKDLKKDVSQCHYAHHRSLHEWALDQSQDFIIRGQQLTAGAMAQHSNQ